MGSNALGWLISLGVDPSQAQSALGGLSQSARKSFDEIAGGAKGVDKNLLSNRESARLLAEELGVRLPRGVTNAISEMLPAIGGFGGAMLAAFAVKEAIEFRKELQNVANAWGGFNEEVQKGLADDIKASDDCLTHFRGLTTGLKIATAEQLIAETQANIVRNELAKQALLDSQTGLKTLGEISGAAVTFGLSLAPLIKNKYDLNQATTVETKLNELLGKQEEGLGKLEEEQNKELAKGVKGHKEAAKAIHEHTTALIYGTGALPQWVQDEYKATVAIDGMTESVDLGVESLRVWMGQMDRLPDELDVAKQGYAGFATQIANLTTAQNEQNKGMLQSTEGVAQNAAAILDTLGAKREYAAVMAIYETAKGFEALGDFDFWGAAQDFASAAMYAKVAGTSEHRHSASASGGRGGSGGGGGSRATQGVERGGGGGGSRGGGGSIGQSIVQVSGGNLSTLGQQQLSAWVGLGQSIGIVKFNSGQVPAPRY